MLVAEKIATFSPGATSRLKFSNTVAEPRYENVTSLQVSLTPWTVGSGNGTASLPGSMSLGREKRKSSSAKAVKKYHTAYIRFTTESKFSSKVPTMTSAATNWPKVS